MCVIGQQCSSTLTWAVAVLHYQGLSVLHETLSSDDIRVLHCMHMIMKVEIDKRHTDAYITL